MLRHGKRVHSGQQPSTKPPMRAGHVTIECLPSLHTILGSTPSTLTNILWHMPVIPALKRWRQEIQRFKFIFNYIVFRPSLGCLRPFFKSNKNAITVMVWALPSGHHFKTPSSSASSTCSCRR